MANAIQTNFNYTYPGELSLEMFYAPSVQTPDITKLFTVRTGIKSKQQLATPQVLSKIVKAYNNTGSYAGTGSPVDLTNRTIEVDDFEFRVDQRADQFEQTVLEQLLPDGVRANELGPQLRQIMVNVVLDAVRRDNFRIFSFGDKTAADANYNMTDGLFRKLIDGVGSGVIRPDDITALGSSATTKAVAYLRNAYAQADAILAQVEPAKKKFFVTRNIFENYITNLEEKGNARDGVLLVQEGIQRAFFRGIEVVPVYSWEPSLADTDNPFNTVLNTAIVYTTAENHIVGVENAANQGEVELWYERKDRKFYAQGRYRMGYQYLHDGLQTISYGIVT